MANERTFLAWIRTALALVAGGVAVRALDLPAAPAVQQGIALVLVVLGAGSAVQAWSGWAAAERALRQGRPLRGPVAVGPVAAGVVVVAVALAVALVVR